VDLQTATDAIKLLYQTALANLAPLNISQTTWQTLTVYWFAAGASGSAVQASSNFTTTNVGTGTNSSPFSTALVLSKKTALLTRSGRGRAYWPATAATSFGAFSTAQVGTLVTGFKTLYDTLKASGAGVFTALPLVVQSNKMGVNNACVSISADTRPDRIEHRERHVTYARSSAVLA
jgi:hypothetical protein